MSAGALPSALVTGIREGAYPDSEDVISSEVTADSLNASLGLAKREKGALEGEVRTLSQNDTSGIDDWISKARQLSIDIEKAKAIAREIVTQNKASQKHANKIEDARAKYGLLKAELNFNDQIIQSLNITKKLQVDLHVSAEKIALHDFVGASATILGVEQQLKHHGRTLGIGTVDIIRRQLSSARDSSIERLQTLLSSMIKLDQHGSGSRLILSYSPNIGNSGVSYSIDAVVDALNNLQALDRTIDRLSLQLERRILKPVLLPSRSEGTVIQRRDETSIECFAEKSASTTSSVIESLSIFLTFFQTSMTTSISNELVQRILPNLVTSVINYWLTPSIPLRLSDLHEFDAIQRLARRFSDSFPCFVTESKEQLADWVDRAPRLWISKRRTAALDDVRRCLKTSEGEKKTVERIEKQKISNREVDLASNTATHAREADSGDDEEKRDATVGKAPSGATDDEDDSGWGFDDNNVSAEASSATHHPEQNQDEDEVDDDAWGWGDEATANDVEHTNEESSKSHLPKAVNGHTPAQGNSDDSEREVVLKETYTITDVPEIILDIIKQQIEDAQKLQTLDDAVLDKTASSAGLLSLPTLILAMFRATASTFYASGMEGGQMHLYNDCVFLADQLLDIASQPHLKKLKSDAAALEKFAKSAYSQEMDTQRIVLGDLLDGAQGFSSCTQQPFARECETAVSSIVERLKLLYRAWQPILSHSALLQSIGSLLARAVDKMTRDIEDMENISDPESQRLASFCHQIAELENLFLPLNTAELNDQNVVPLTAVYVSNWLRFRYLAEILESKLADITYLWTKAELSLEFTEEEVIDLVRALFEDSHYRKNAIAEIRKYNPSHERNT